MILLLLAVFAAGTANAAFPEPMTRTDIVTGDSIAPMKIEIDLKTSNAETRTVILTNTGETATEYICFVEQTGGKKDISAVFELSESKITLLPGDSKKLEIKIPVPVLITNSADAEYKLKIIRNPETQTPVGYIIPINLTGSDPAGKTSGRESSTDMNVTSAAPERETESENKSSGETENGRPTDVGRDEKRSDNSFTKKSGIFFFLIFLMLAASVAGTFIQKKKKKGKD